MRLDSSLKESRPQYISAQNISTLFDALDEREIASFILYMPSLVEIPLAVSDINDVKDFDICSRFPWQRRPF